MLKEAAKRAMKEMQKYKEKKVEIYIKKINTRSPIIILGTQKTGSTAIAALLSQATNRSITLDITRAIPDGCWQLAPKYGLDSFDNFVYKYRKEFSRDIIKEPSLTYFYDELRMLFPSAQYVMIQRDPVQNIRSILNRLEIPGDLPAICYDEWPELVKTPVWRLAMDSSWLGRPSDFYIEALAHRWDLAAKIYLDNPDKFTLIKYEDFKKDKKNKIKSLADALGLEVVNDITNDIDQQYQRKGNSDVTGEEFFGKENLQVIRKICGHHAKCFDYSI